MKSFFLSLIILTMTSIFAFAEDVSFEARVDANPIALGQSAHLVLTVKGSQKVDPISLPAIDGIDARYVGPQTEVSIVNGNYATSKSFVYALFPNKAGRFTIPSMSVTIDGKDYQSQPIDLEIKDTAGANSNAATAAPGAPTAENLKDKIMLILGTPRKQIYEHEQIPLTIRLLYNGVNINEIQYPALDLTGFSKAEFQQPQQSQETINGVAYNVVDFKTFIAPTRTGPLTVGPAKLEASLLYRSADQNNPRNIFGNDIFDSFFTSYEKRPLTVSSQPLAIDVLPLPEEGRPKDFSGAVGKFDFIAKVSPTEVKVGDPITLRMTVTGDGNLKSITMPALTDPNFKTYDPQIKDEGNTKSLEQVIIPTLASITEVPAFRFSYFDTEAKEYKIITQGWFPVSVTAPKAGEEFKAVGFETAAPTVNFKEEVGRDIIFIKERPGLARTVGYHIYKTVFFWLLVGMYGIGFSIFLAIYLLKRKLKTDVRFARKFKAPRQARLGLEEAQTFMNQGNVKEFYTSVDRTLKDYLGNQLHIPSGGMTFATVERLLRSRQIDEKIIQSIQVIFEAADMVRFASMTLDDGSMNKAFESLKTIIDYLERHL